MLPHKRMSWKNKFLICYATPVILVKKKDGEWRMRVDYRYLNALIVKNKCSGPMIDELLGSYFFTKLETLLSSY